VPNATREESIDGENGQTRDNHPRIEEGGLRLSNRTDTLEDVQEKTGTDEPSEDEEVARDDEEELQRTSLPIERIDESTEFLDTERGVDESVEVMMDMQVSDIDEAVQVDPIDPPDAAENYAEKSGIVVHVTVNVNVAGQPNSDVEVEKQEESVTTSTDENGETTVEIVENLRIPAMPGVTTMDEGSTRNEGTMDDGTPTTDKAIVDTEEDDGITREGEAGNDPNTTDVIKNDVPDHVESGAAGQVEIDTPEHIENGAQAHVQDGAVGHSGQDTSEQVENGTPDHGESNASGNVENETTEQVESGAQDHDKNGAPARVENGTRGHIENGAPRHDSANEEVESMEVEGMDEDSQASDAMINEVISQSNVVSGPVGDEGGALHGNEDNARTLDDDVVDNNAGSDGTTLKMEEAKDDGNTPGSGGGANTVEDSDEEANAENMRAADSAVGEKKNVPERSSSGAEKVSGFHNAEPPNEFDSRGTEDGHAGETLGPNTVQNGPEISRIDKEEIALEEKMEVDGVNDEDALNDSEESKGPSVPKLMAIESNIVEEKDTHSTVTSDVKVGQPGSATASGANSLAGVPHLHASKESVEPVNPRDTDITGEGANIDLSEKNITGPTDATENIPDSYVHEQTSRDADGSLGIRTAHDHDDGPNAICTAYDAVATKENGAGSNEWEETDRNRANADLVNEDAVISPSDPAATAREDFSQESLSRSGSDIKAIEPFAGCSFVVANSSPLAQTNGSETHLRDNGEVVANSPSDSSPLAQTNGSETHLHDNGEVVAISPTDSSSLAQTNGSKTHLRDNGEVVAISPSTSSPFAPLHGSKTQQLNDGKDSMEAEMATEEDEHPPFDVFGEGEFSVTNTPISLNSGSSLKKQLFNELSEMNGVETSKTNSSSLLAEISDNGSRQSQATLREIMKARNDLGLPHPNDNLANEAGKVDARTNVPGESMDFEKAIPNDEKDDDRERLDGGNGQNDDGRNQSPNKIELEISFELMDSPNPEMRSRAEIRKDAGNGYQMDKDFEHMPSQIKEALTDGNPRNNDSDGSGLTSTQTKTHKNDNEEDRERLGGNVGQNQTLDKELEISFELMDFPNPEMRSRAEIRKDAGSGHQVSEDAENISSRINEALMDEDPRTQNDERSDHKSIRTKARGNLRRGLENNSDDLGIMMETDDLETDMKSNSVIGIVGNFFGDIIRSIRPQEEDKGMERISAKSSRQSQRKKNNMVPGIEEEENEEEEDGENEKAKSNEEDLSAKSEREEISTRLSSHIESKEDVDDDKKTASGITRKPDEGSGADFNDLENEEEYKWDLMGDKLKGLPRRKFSEGKTDGKAIKEMERSSPSDERQAEEVMTNDVGNTEQPASSEDENAIAIIRGEERPEVAPDEGSDSATRIGSVTCLSCDLREFEGQDSRFSKNFSVLTFVKDRKMGKEEIRSQTPQMAREDGQDVKKIPSDDDAKESGRSKATSESDKGRGSTILLRTETNDTSVSHELNGRNSGQGEMCACTNDTGRQSIQPSEVNVGEDLDETNKRLDNARMKEKESANNEEAEVRVVNDRERPEAPIDEDNDPPKAGSITCLSCTLRDFQSDDSRFSKNFLVATFSQMEDEGITRMSQAEDHEEEEDHGMQMDEGRRSSQSMLPAADDEMQREGMKEFDCDLFGEGDLSTSTEASGGSTPATPNGEETQENPPSLEPEVTSVGNEAKETLEDENEITNDGERERVVRVDGNCMDYRRKKPQEAMVNAMDTAVSSNLSAIIKDGEVMSNNADEYAEGDSGPSSRANSPGSSFSGVKDTTLDSNERDVSHHDVETETSETTTQSDYLGSKRQMLQTEQQTDDQRENPTHSEAKSISTSTRICTVYGRKNAKRPSATNFNGNNFPSSSSSLRINPSASSRNDWKGLTKSRETLSISSPLAFWRGKVNAEESQPQQQQQQQLTSKGERAKVTVKRKRSSTSVNNHQTEGVTGATAKKSSSKIEDTNGCFTS